MGWGRQLPKVGLKRDWKHYSWGYFSCPRHTDVGCVCRDMDGTQVPMQEKTSFACGFQQHPKATVMGSDAIWGREHLPGTVLKHQRLPLMPTLVTFSPRPWKRAKGTQDLGCKVQEADLGEKVSLGPGPS